MSEATAAIEELYETELPALLRYFVAGRVGRDVAEDLAQDTFREAIRHPERVAAAESPRAYMFGIARNLRRRFFRGLMNAVPFEEQTLTDSTDELATEDPRIEKLQLAMLQLDDLHREILELRLHQDLRYAEIAELLSIPIGTVRSRIHHSIAKLRTYLSEE
jgi:RNA polymerase sigma-70 factor (ECF subfamily)